MRACGVRAWHRARVMFRSLFELLVVAPFIALVQLSCLRFGMFSHYRFCTILLNYWAPYTCVAAELVERETVEAWADFLGFRYAKLNG